MRLKELKTQATVTETPWFKTLSRLGHQWSHPQGYTKLAVEYAREMSNNKDLHPQEVIHKIVQDYPQEVNERDLIAYINNLVKKGRLPQSLTAEDSNDTITYTNPNFDNEWDEATRYDEFKNIGKEKWIALAKTGKVVDYNTETVKKIKNTEAGDVKEFDKLDPKKQKRALQQISTGEVELPIVASYSDGWLELVGGNTRLTAAIKATGEGKVWQFDVPDSLQEGLGDWSSNAWNRFKDLFRSDDDDHDALKWDTDIKQKRDDTKQQLTGKHQDSDTLTQGPPFENKSEVKRMQQKLVDRGYDIGSTGVDGYYGRRTAAAVRSFKRDYNIPGLGSTMKPLDLLTLYKSKSMPKKQAPTVKITVDQQIEIVLDLISKAESQVGGKNRGYDAIYGGRNPKILNMTIDDLFADQLRRIRDPNNGFSASGRYQFLRSTLKGVVKRMGLDTKTTIFSPATQDKIVIFHLYEKRHSMGKWMNGDISNEEFLKNLALSWAGLPKDISGKSAHKGTGNNKANVSYQEAMNDLDAAQSVGA